MNASSILPISTTGHSARPDTSSSRPSSSIQSSPSAKAFCFIVVQDDAAALVGVQHHMRIMQFLDVIVEAADLDRPLRQEAMAIGRASAFDACEGERHDLAVAACTTMACSGRTQRTGRARPAHGFRPGQFRERLGKDFRQHSAVGRPARLIARDIELALAVVLFRALLERDAGRAQETFDRLLRRADARTFAFFLDVVLLRGQTRRSPASTGADRKTP